MTDFDIFPVDERKALPDGESDLTNRYTFTVMIQVSTTSGKTITCSGVLVTPRLVLTAGHCVCVGHMSPEPGNSTKTLIDSANCAESASVMTVLYGTPDNGPRSPLDGQFKSYEGKVHPHPGLEVVLEGQSALSSANDLAAIVLDEPVEDADIPLRLANKEVEVGEPVLIVGYGYDAMSDLIHGVRRFGRKKVSMLPRSPSEGIFFEQLGATAFSSGSGEPCLRQKGRDLVLVGITSKNLGEKPTFMSAYQHRDWLLFELQLAAKEGSP